MGRLMGLDYGEKRIGVALSDPTRTIARPLTIVQRGSRTEDFDRLAKLASDNEVERIVVGHPLSLDGQEGPQARTVRRWSQALARSLLISIELWDETLSTAEAQTMIQLRPKKTARPRQPLDALAAATILQDYLDAHREEA